MAIIFRALERADREASGGTGVRIAWPVPPAVTAIFSPAVVGGALASLLAGLITGAALLPAPSRPPTLPMSVRLGIPPLPVPPVTQVPRDAEVPLPAPAPAEPPKLAALPPPIPVAPRPARSVPLPKEPEDGRSQSAPAGPPETVAAPASPKDWLPKVTKGTPVAATLPRAVVNLRPLADGGLEIATSLYREASARAEGIPPKAILPAQQRQYREAQLDLEHAKIREPNSPAVAVQLGLVLARLGQVDAGLAELRRATQLHPNSPTYKTCLAILLDFAGRRQDALVFYQDVHQLVTDGPGSHWRTPLPLSLVEIRERIDLLKRSP